MFCIYSVFNVVIGLALNVNLIITTHKLIESDHNFSLTHWFFRIQAKIVEPYNKIVARTAQLRRLQVSHPMLRYQNDTRTHFLDTQILNTLNIIWKLMRNPEHISPLYGSEFLFFLLIQCLHTPELFFIAVDCLLDVILCKCIASTFLYEVQLVYVVVRGHYTLVCISREKGEDTSLGWVLVIEVCCFVFLSFTDTDLHAVIKKGGILKDIHKRYIMYQLINATMYLHSGNVIHRDQKVTPE